DVDDSKILKNGFLAIQKLVADGSLLAYHDRSDGGLISAVLEMAFASRCGLELDIDTDFDALSVLFNEELGVLFQVADDHLSTIEAVCRSFGLSEYLSVIGKPVSGERVSVSVNRQEVLDASRVALHRSWSETSYQMQSLRDNPACSQQEYDRLLDTADTGLSSDLSFDPKQDVAAKYVGGTYLKGVKPKVAILREQGVNGHIEMGAAFTQSGFSAIDVTMTDIKQQRVDLADFNGLVACGGFSYGDVLGAGEGWAKSILFNNQVRDSFEAYFQRQDAFSLGICNGCQMMSNLKEIIPGADAWPHFVRNASEQFEARVVQAEIAKSSNSLFLAGMQGSKLPVVVAHGEGRAEFSAKPSVSKSRSSNLALSYIDYRGKPTEAYPANPNGSPDGIAGLTNDDGRVTIMMPHPERIFRSSTNSWQDQSWGEYSPWMRMFRNARVWVN
ncbi:MAG: phosphoribosylformylglycinamidine synthase, partial [Arenicella sp.]